MRFDENKDGTVIVTLDEPVRWNGSDDLQRLTIPKIRGRHLRLAPWQLSGAITLGNLCDFAAQLVEPLGAFDELGATDARDVALHVGGMLGKSRATGEEPSPS